MGANQPEPKKRPELLAQLRHLKMARSAHAYVRGSTVKFYEWLEDSGEQLPEGPSVWICGDCHVGNLGPLADKKGRVAVQIRDLDQTVIGNPTHDLVRLALSLASAARGSDLPGVTTAHMLEELISGYQEALEGDFDTPQPTTHRPKLIQALLKRAVKRRWRHLAEERIEDVTPSIPRGKRFWSLAKREWREVAALFETDEARHMITALKNRDKDDRINLLDAAYWVKGCSSLGRIRYAALVGIGKDKPTPDSMCLIDIKEGVTAAAPRSAKARMPRDNAVRVVTGARALSPNLGGRMIAGKLVGKGVVIREMMPQDLKIDIDQLTRGEACSIAKYLAGIVGHAHGRQMTLDQRRSWASDLARNRPKTLDAPSWLWSSVVELLAAHEAAYLDHCRRHAMMVAA